MPKRKLKLPKKANGKTRTAVKPIAKAIKATPAPRLADDEQVVRAVKFVAAQAGVWAVDLPDLAKLKRTNTHALLRKAGLNADCLTLAVCHRADGLRREEWDACKEKWFPHSLGDGRWSNREPVEILTPSMGEPKIKTTRRREPSLATTGEKRIPRTKQLAVHMPLEAEAI